MLILAGEINMYVYILSVDNSPELRVFLDPELAMEKYIEHIKERIPGDVTDEELHLDADNGEYTAYWDDELIAELFHVKVEQ